MQIIKEYRCESKIRSFMFDNTSVNKYVINKLRTALNLDFGYFLFHVHCLFNLFNLIVQNNMKHISKQIGRIRMHYCTSLYHLVENKLFKNILLNFFMESK